MRRILTSILAAVCLLRLCASDVTDARPPWDAIKLVSFNRGDASDRSWLNQTATTSAGVTFPAGYRVADFDGSSSAVITYPDTGDFEAAPATLMFWARIDSSSPRVSLVAKNTSTAAPVFYRGWYCHFIGTAAGSNGLTIVTETDSTNYRILYSGSATTYGDGTWRHYAWACDSISSNAGWVFYVNGEAISMTSLTLGSVTTVANGEPLTLGGFTTANQTARLNGALDDVRIYNRVLSANEIGAIYAEGIGDSRP